MSHRSRSLSHRAGWRVIALCLATILAGCASVPTQEMSDARRALEAAEHAQAERHAPYAMSRASVSLDRASAALRAGDFVDAQVLARAARDEAIAARRLADTVRDTEEAIAEAQVEGRPWQGARDLLDMALQVSRGGDATRALAMAGRAHILAR